MTLKSNFLPSVDLFLWYFEEVKKLFWHTYVLEVVLISVNEESVSRVFAALLVGLMTYLLARGLVILSFDLFGRGIMKGSKLN